MSEYTRIAERATHTPGPWQPDKTWVCIGYGITATIIRIFANVATDDELLADANLIAAAPDLLTVVEMLEANHDVELHLDWSNCDCPVATLGRAAIAKARGSVCTS